MPVQKLALQPGAPPKLEIHTAGLGSEIRFDYDGETLGTFTRAELESAADMRLPDGSILTARWEQRGFLGTGNGGLHLVRDGKPLPGSVGDPEAQIKAAAGIVYFVAALNAFCGVIGMTADDLGDAGFGIANMALAFVFAILGFFTMRRSRIALGLAMGIYGLDGVATLALSVSAGGSVGVGGIFVRVILLAAMWRGFVAMGQVAAGEAAAP